CLSRRPPSSALSRRLPWHDSPLKVLKPTRQNPNPNSDRWEMVADEHYLRLLVGPRGRDTVGGGHIVIRGRWFWPAPISGCAVTYACRDETPGAGFVAGTGRFRASRWKLEDIAGAACRLAHAAHHRSRLSTYGGTCNVPFTPPQSEKHCGG